MVTLVTGATGFVGSHLVRRLVAEGRRVRCFVRPISDTSALLRLANIELVCGDVTDVACLTEAARGADSVFHLAVDYFRSSLDDVRALITASHASRVKRVVYFSSIAAVGPAPQGGAIVDDMPCR